MSAINNERAFTLLELLVAVAVLAMLVAIIFQIFNSAASLTTLGGKRMDADNQARTTFDRMEIDLRGLVLRPDVDYYLKTSAATANGSAIPQIGNDQIAFFGQLAGYYPGGLPSKDQAPLSLISYRINQGQLQRLGKGLVWNGVTQTNSFMVFSPLTIAGTWPTAVDSSSDTDYELVGPQVFRFEYYYILKGVSLFDGTTLPSAQSDVPWDTRSPLNHNSVEGMRDVSALVVTIAVVDPRSRLLISQSDLTDLSQAMPDYTPNMKSGELAETWQNVVGNSSLPRPATAGIRIYSRTFYLNSILPR